MRRVLAANRSLTVAAPTVAAPILALAFSATFDTNLMIYMLMIIQIIDIGGATVFELKYHPPIARNRVHGNIYPKAGH